MSKQYAAEIKDRDLVESVFLVKEKNLAMAKNGKPYLNVRLMDRSGDIEAKIWDNADEIANRFEREHFVSVKGKASVYMNKMQLVVAEIRKVDDSLVNLSDFLPVSPRGIDEMLTELDAVVESIADPYLNKLMRLFAGDPAFMERYAAAPAAKGMHHVYIGGLLEHSLAVARLARAVMPLYEGVNRDLVLVGALLHDVGKIHEMCYSRVIDYTDEGKLVGHITIGVELLSEKIRGVEGFPAEMAMLLKHMLLSHHGEYEYGSPKRPKTIEATILHYLDDLDSKINGIRSHMEKEKESASRWTAHHRLYDRYFFKGNSIGEPPEEESGTETETAAELPVTPEKSEKVHFSNAPFKKLENLNLEF